MRGSRLAALQELRERLRQELSNLGAAPLARPGPAREAAAKRRGARPEGARAQARVARRLGPGAPSDTRTQLGTPWVYPWHGARHDAGCRWALRTAETQARPVLFLNFLFARYLSVTPSAAICGRTPEYLALPPVGSRC